MSATAEMKCLGKQHDKALVFVPVAGRPGGTILVGSFVIES